jgi:hypothetical protein
MAATFNFPKDLSTISWLPVQFQSTDQESVAKNNIVQFENGIRFSFNQCLKEYNDFSINKNSGLFLTNLSNTSNLLENVAPPDNQNNLEEILTPIAKVSLPTDLMITIYDNQLSATNRVADNDYGIPTNFTSQDNLKFVFSIDTSHVFSDADEKLVSIETPNVTKLDETHPDNYVLTWIPTENPDYFDLKFLPRKYPESYTQKFAYFLSKDGISLFLPNTRFYYIVRQNLNSNTYGVGPFTPVGDTGIPVYTAFFRFLSYENSREDITLIKDSHLTKYNVNILDYQQSVIPDFQTSLNPYLQNFLGIFAVENWRWNEDQNTAVYDLNFSGLKNYQTPEYQYSFNSTLIDGYPGLHRIYDQLFTGTNQHGGSDSIYLGYQSNTTEITFEVDKETSFNFSPVAPNIPLSAAGLIEDGAIAGHHPYVSDRILVKQMDYANLMPGLEQPLGIPKETNTWFCSWLSGSESGERMWMDRYYNAAYYTLDQALSAQTLVYNDKIDPSKPYIYDVPSTMLLAPGAFYKYFHMGHKTSKEFLKFLDGYKDSPYGSKILEISSWNASPLVDSSGYNNNGIVYSESFNGYNGVYWELDGTNHAIFPAKTVLLEPRQFTTSLWVYSEDWNNIQGRQIFGNFYDSGYGLINESALTAPLFTFVEGISGQVFNLNYRFKTTHIDQISATGIMKDYISVRLPDFSCWIFNTQTGYGYKYDAEGRLINTSDKVLKVTQVELDDKLNLYLYQPSRQKVIILDSNGKIVNEYIVSNKKTKRIELYKYTTLNYQRLNYIQVLEVFGNASVIDNEGNLWQVLGSNLYKSVYNATTDIHGEPVVFATTGPVQQISCDSYNNLWIIHKDDSISKLTPRGVFNTTRIGKRVGLPVDPCETVLNRYRYINFLKTPEHGNIGCEKYSVKDLAIIIDSRDNEMILLDINMDIISKTDLTLLNGLKSTNYKFFASGDFTGYQHLRKFSFDKKNLSWKFKVMDPDGSNAEVVSLQYDTASLYPGWHHIAVTFDSERGVAKYYIDSQLVDQTTLKSNYPSGKNREIFFDYRSSLLLGSDSIKNSSLNDIINIQDAYKFVGRVADLKIYNKTLSSGDIAQLYFSFDYSDNRKPLIWNMPTGSRNYIEEIKQWFQMQLPGSKSNYFNINIRNLPITDDNVKMLIEDAIRKNVQRIIPAHTSLYKINWL